jgi:hypothetical protein
MKETKRKNRISKKSDDGEVLKGRKEQGDGGEVLKGCEMKKKAA